MGNNNSSRYGVVTQLQFDDGDIPKMVGSLNRTYLLEKSRVVSRSSRERNFHVFYQMVGSDDEEFKRSLQLSGENAWTTWDYFLLTIKQQSFKDQSSGVQASTGSRALWFTGEHTEGSLHRSCPFSSLYGIKYLCCVPCPGSKAVAVSPVYVPFPYPTSVCSDPRWLPSESLDRNRNCVIAAFLEAYRRRLLGCRSLVCSLLPEGKTSNDFKYLTTQAPAEDQDFTGLAEVQDAIRELGIEIEEEKDVFKALGGLLHLGQVLFASNDPSAHGSGCRGRHCRCDTSNFTIDSRDKASR